MFFIDYILNIQHIRFITIFYKYDACKLYWINP